MSFIYVPSTGGGPSSGLTVKNAAGTTLSTGQTLRGNAATVAGVTGFAQLDAAGNFVGNWIPRTGTLAALLALAGTSGQIASATDTPAIVQFDGTAGQAVAFYPYGSSVSLSVAGAGAVAGTVPAESDIVRVTVAAGVTGYTGTLAAGSIDGQELQVELISSPAGLAAYTLNGTLVAGTGADILAHSVTPAAAVVVRYKWNEAGADWQQVSAADILRNAADSVAAIAIGPGAEATALQSLAVGINALAVGKQSNAIGQGSQALSPTSVAVGVNNTTATGVGSFAFGSSALAEADQCIAIGAGNGVTAPGALGIAVNVVAPYAIGIGVGSGTQYGFSGLQVNGGGSGNQGQAFTYTTPGGAFPGAVTLIANTVAGLEVGQQINVPGLLTIGSSANSYWLTGTITAINTGTRQVTASLTAPSNAAVTSLRPGGSFYECSGGQLSTSIGPATVTQNKGEFAIGPGSSIAAAGDWQASTTWLAIQTTDATASVVLTTDATAANTNLEAGNSNRFQIQSGEARECLLRIVAKQAGSENCIKFLRTFLVVNNGGTVTLSALSGLGTDVGLGTTQWTTTWVASPPFSVVANNTQKSVDVEVTGLAATTINWCATIESTLVNA